MKTNELRIGNWIMGIGCMRVTELKTELGNNFITASNKDVVYMDEEDNFQPIELTEEVLVKIGFKKERQLISTLFYLDYETDVDNIIRVKYVIYLKAPSLLKITTSQYGNYECFEFMKRGIKYLHQLQNAYYCLTGEEMEVNL